MAKQTYTVKSIKEMSLSQLEDLSTNELRKATNVLINASNKRFERLKKAGIQSTAYQDWDSNKRNKIFTKLEMLNVSDERFRHILFTQLQRTMAFLYDPTSTLRGAKKEQRDLKESVKQFTLGENVQDSFSKFDKEYGKYATSLIASAINKFKEAHRSIYLASGASFAETVMVEYSKNKGVTSDELLARIEQYMGVSPSDNTEMPDEDTDFYEEDGPTSTFGPR